MDKKEAARQVIASMKIEGFIFTEEEEQALYELSSAEYYRWCNSKLPPEAKRVRIAITDCGHNPNMGNKKMPAVGQKIICPLCKAKTTVIDIVI